MVSNTDLTGQSFDENLHSSSQSQNQMKSRFLLDIVVGQSTTIFQLFSGEDQSLLVWGDTFLILDLGFDIIDSV
jgi:hypothetical protein